MLSFCKNSVNKVLNKPMPMSFWYHAGALVYSVTAMTAIIVAGNAYDSHKRKSALACPDSSSTQTSATKLQKS